MGRFHDLLGASRYAEFTVNWDTEFTVNWDTDGTSIYLSYDTTYELGKATEQFVWIVEGEKARLKSYQIDSRQLILR